MLLVRYLYSGRAHNFNMMGQLLPVGIASVALSLALSAATYIITPKIGKIMLKKRIFGIDVHKKSRPKIPQMGGVVILPALLFLLIFVYAITNALPVLLVAASTAAFGAYGLLDDVKRLGKYQKLLLSAAMGTLLIIPSNTGLLFFVPLLFLTISIGNIFNLFAGFNGLEVGCTTLISFFFSMLCLLSGNMVPFYLSFGMFLVLFAFLMHNKYPARIFPGNIGTFTVGGFFAGICLYYNLYHLLIPLTILHIADVAFKGISAGYFSSHEKLPTKINGRNILVPGRDYLSLSRFVLRIRPMTEKQLVFFFWSVLALVGSATLIVFGALA